MGISIRLLPNVSSPSADCFGELLEDLNRGIPVDTSVSDTDSLL